MYNQIDSNKRRTVILIVIFIAVILALGWLFGNLYDYGYGGLFIAIIISTGMTLVGYYQGDKVALWTSGAKAVEKADNPYLYRIVENLCITTGIPTPRVYLINDPAINAFATGRDPEHSSIAVTVGAVEKLKNEELEGVVAHELSHVKNYDIRLMTIVIVLVGIVSLLSNFMFRANLFGGRRSSNDRSEGGAILMIVGLILMIFAPLVSSLIQLAISRRREYLADASGALLTRYPEGLASALERIKLENLPTRNANNATAHLYFANPFSGRKISTLFSTHPPIDERIAALRQMA